MAIQSALSDGSPNEGWIRTGQWAMIAWSGWTLSRLETKLITDCFRALAGCAFLACFISALSSSTAPIGHVSYWADFLVLVLPWAFYFFLHDRGFAARAFWAVNAAFLLYTLWQTASRASALAVVFQILTAGFFLVRSARERQRPLYARAALTIILIVGSCVLIGSLLPHHRFRVTGIVERVDRTIRILETGEYKTDERWQIYNATLGAMDGRWAQGWGYGSFRYLYPKFAQEQSPIFLKNEWLMHPHNEPLMQLFEGGLIGLGLFAFIAFLLAAYLAKHALERPANPAAITLFIGLASYALSIQFTTTLTNAVERAALIPYLALTYKIIQPHLPALGPNPFQRSRTLRAFAVAGLAFFGVIAVGNAIASYCLSSAQVQQAMDGKTRRHRLAAVLSPNTFDTLLISAQLERLMGNMDLAESYFKKGLGLFPYTPYFYLDLGALYLQTGRIPEAKRVFSELGGIYPSYPPFLLYMEEVRRLEATQGPASPD